MGVPSLQEIRVRVARCSIGNPEIGSCWIFPRTCFSHQLDVAALAPMRYAYQLNPGGPAAGQPSTPVTTPAHPVTTSPKPPLDEQGHNSGWAAASDNPTAGPDHLTSERDTSEKDGLEPPTQRQPARTDAPSEVEVEPEREGMFGAAVPYGGDDRTEEIDPVALDMPFTPDDRKTPPAPAVSTAESRRPRASSASVL